MFSGIVREIGTIRRLEKAEESWKLFVDAPMFADAQGGAGVALGDSVAVCGVCLTHTAEAPNLGSFDIATETRRVTKLGDLELGQKVNLERSLAVGERLDGHFVSGHVDVVSEVLSIEKTSNTQEVQVSLPEKIRPYIAEKGSVAIDGVSLTVGSVSLVTFSVYVIPHTFEQTLFSEYSPGTKVNIEVDVLARYAVNALQCVKSEVSK